MKLLNLFRKKKPVYGASIFYQRTWLSKQVDEAMYKRQLEQHSPALGNPKPQ